MRIGFALTLCLLACLAVGCAAVEKPQGPPDGAVASRPYYAPASDVVEAIRQAVGDYDLTVTETANPAPGLWVLKLKKGPLNSFPEDIRQFEVQAASDGPTLVHLIVDRSFWKRWSSEPEWADTVFTAIYQHLP